MARARQQGAQRKEQAGATAPAFPTPASCPQPEDRAAYLDLIRALARVAARADHAREREGRPN